MRGNIPFYLSLLNLILLGKFADEAFEEPISYALFALLTVGLLALAIRRKRAGAERGRTKSTGDLMWKRLVSNKNAIFGLAILIVIVYISILAPFVSPHDPLDIDWGALNQGSSADHWLGTDDMGRDIMSRAIYGTRIAIGIGLAAVILNTLIGTALGLIAGYYGGKTDNLIMRMLEIWNSVPFILLAIAVMAALGTGIGKLIVIVSLSNLMAFARIIRGSVLLIRESDFIAASKIIGISDLRILTDHVIPNCISPILVLASLSIGETILVIAGLSFLGLGVQPPMASLGAMLSNGQQFLHDNVLMSLVPGAAILLIVLSFNLFGDGMRDALDTKLND